MESRARATTTDLGASQSNAPRPALLHRHLPFNTTKPSKPPPPPHRLLSPGRIASFRGPGPPQVASIGSQIRSKPNERSLGIQNHSNHREEVGAEEGNLWDGGDERRGEFSFGFLLLGLIGGGEVRRRDTIVSIHKLPFRIVFRLRVDGD